VRDYLESGGPLGFPVVDVGVTLTDGSYHTVDSSDMAFKQAARIGMVEGMAEAMPVLLEPVMDVTVYCPSDANARINAILSRGAARSWAPMPAPAGPAGTRSARRCLHPSFRT
jgi:elongation factor G